MSKPQNSPTSDAKSAHFCTSFGDSLVNLRSKLWSFSSHTTAQYLKGNPAHFPAVLVSLG